MGRRRNAETGAKGDEPACPNNHTLKRSTADADFTCDGCAVDINEGCCYYGCEPCDYSLCGGCYVKLATGTMEQETKAEQSEDVIRRKIEAEVADLCDHYQLDNRIMLKTTEALLKRTDTYEMDIWGLWQSLKLSKRTMVSGLLMKKIQLMNDGTYVYVPPPKDLQRIIDQYKLDQDARDKLTDLLCKRPDTVEADLIDIENRLKYCGNPSSLVMKIIMALDRGTALPEAHNKPPPGGDSKGGKGGRKGRSRSRNRDRGDRDSDRDRRGGGYYGDRDRDDRDRDRRGGYSDRNRDHDRDRSRDRRE